MSTTIRDSLWRIIFRGALGTEEEFAHGWWATHDTADTEIEVSETWNDAMNTFLATSASGTGFTTVADFFPAAVTWLSMSVRPYSASTGLPTATALDSELVTPVSGTGGQSLPFQDAWVMTLWDGSTIGRARYNRFYLPPFVPTTLTTNGKVFSTIPPVLLAAMKATDDAAQAKTNPGELNVFHIHAHTVSGCNFFRGDEIIDTQRRRRNQLSSVPATLAAT